MLRNVAAMTQNFYPRMGIAAQPSFRLTPPIVFLNLTAGDQSSLKNGIHIQGDNGTRDKTFAVNP